VTVDSPNNKEQSLTPSIHERDRNEDRAGAGAAWLARGNAEVQLREPARLLGLSRTDSIPRLTRLVEVQIRPSPDLAGELQEIVNRLTEGTKNKV